MARQAAVLLVAAVVAAGSALPVDGSDADEFRELRPTLAAAVSRSASWANSSLSFAIAIGGHRGGRSADPTVIAVAAGTDSARTGARVTTESMYPCGSVTKAYTATALLRQAELGKIDLDHPVHRILDPWSAKQTPRQPSLKALFGGNPIVETITTRQLLQMRSGMQDYDDEAMFNLTLARPDADILPMGFLGPMNKTLMFPPGEGGWYSGNGFVILGMVLAAITGGDSWDQLDQAALLGAGPGRYNSTVFMGAGKCSAHSKVVHQYVYSGVPYAALRAHGAAPLADRTVPVAGAKPGGPASPRVDLAKFSDLDGYSCLNGWTMGNIAAAPKDVVLFYHDLANGKLINSGSLRQMLDYKPFSPGNYDPPTGTPYGLGVFAQQLVFSVQDPAKCVSFNGTFCTCPPGKPASHCVANVSAWGHEGLDWGSAMVQVGYIPALDTSFAMAFNSYVAMNSSLSLDAAMDDIRHTRQFCRAIDPVLRALIPGFPALLCPPCYSHWDCPDGSHAPLTPPKES